MRQGNFLALIRGILLAISLNILAFFIYFLLLYILSASNIFNTVPILGDFLRNYIWIYPVALVGISQWLYMLPVVLWLRRQRRFEVMKGAIIGAVLIMFLNGTCFLLLQASG
jgi:hypothetical protein